MNTGKLLVIACRELKQVVVLVILGDVGLSVYLLTVECSLWQIHHTLLVVAVDAKIEFQCEVADRLIFHIH